VPTKKVRIETGRPGKADAVVYGAEWEAGLSLLGFFLLRKPRERQTILLLGLGGNGTAR